MIASLPMYDFPELSGATDALWNAWRRAAAAHGIDAPELRTRPSGMLLDHWSDPRVLLSQSCGYPFRAALAATVRVVGTFDYDTGGTPATDTGGTPATDTASGAAGGPTIGPGRYRSVLVTRPGLEDAVLADGVRVAINGWESMSGCVSLGVALVGAGVGRIGEALVTGAHADSVVAVAEGRAELASIDGVSWRLFQTLRPAAVAGLVVIGHGPVVPCLPLVTAFPDAVAALRASLGDAVATLAADEPWALAALRIRGFVPLEVSDYDLTLDLARTAARVLPVDLLPTA